MRTLTITILAALVALPAQAQRDDRADRAERPTLTVNGNADVRVAPDVATVRLGVTRQASSAETAQEQVNETAQRILAAIVRLGIAREQIQTSQLTLHPVYSQPVPGRETEQRITGYRASNVVSVRVDRMAQVGPVIDAGLKAGANEVQGVNFGLKDEGLARERALQQAIIEARRKARVMADALEVRLVAVQQVQEGGVSFRPYFAAMGGAMMAREAGTPVEPGEVTVSANVTVTYRIEPVSR